MTHERSDAGALSMTDSPGASYADNLNAAVRTASSIDLTGRLGCHVNYDMRLATESGFDFLRIETATAAGGPYDVGLAPSPLRTVGRPRAGRYRLTLTLVLRNGERTRVRTTIRL